LRKTGDVHRRADSLLCSRLESRKEIIRITAHVPAAAGPFFCTGDIGKCGKSRYAAWGFPCPLFYGGGAARQRKVKGTVCSSLGFFVRSGKAEICGFVWIMAVSLIK
jgi:hypothetical protein